MRKLILRMSMSLEDQDKDIDGYLAVILWRRWERNGDEEALRRLLEYNREDVETLPLLQRQLDERNKGGRGANSNLEIQNSKQF